MLEPSMIFFGSAIIKRFMRSKHPHYFSLFRSLCVGVLFIASATHAPDPVGANAPFYLPEAPQRSDQVEVIYRDFADPGRHNWKETGPRPLRTMIWRPSKSIVARRLPLILISHGSGGLGTHMSWLGNVLASKGYIAAAVDHNGTFEEELNSRPTPSDHFGWERTRDLSVVLDFLLKDPELGRLIDEECVGAAGFSLGGTTVLWLAGARLDMRHLQRNAPPVPEAIAPAIGALLDLPRTNGTARHAQGRSEQSFRDARVRSVFALAPAMGFGFTQEGLRDIHVPVQIVVGSEDQVTPASENAGHFAKYINDARYLVLPGERGHFSAATPEESRPPAMQEVAGLATAFFDEKLRKSSESTCPVITD